MNMRTLPQLLEPDDLLLMPDGERLELIDGIPREKEMGAKSDEIALAAGALLRAHVRANGLGRVFGSQTGYRCFPNPRQRRLPDASFVAAGRLPNDQPPEGDIAIAPDLAVEAVSPNDTYEEVMERVTDYKAARVRLIWVISPKTKTVLVRRLDGTCAEIGEAGELSGEDVVAGFTCKVADLFA